ncbi:SIR2 family NAD-dependent protein deacylase [Mucilaginibacter phyllosphaerae]
MIDSKRLKPYKYLKHFPIPFLEDLLSGQVLPFIGAGFSKNAFHPMGKEMPDWIKLAEMISKDLDAEYEFSDPIDAISAYEHEFGRAKLVEKMNTLLLTSQIKPGKAHLAFSKIPFKLVGTTNFDFLLEKAYEQSGQFYCRPVIDEEHLAINNNHGDEVALLKVHGDLHHPTRMVATESDYDGFLNNYPLLATFLANLLITKTCLFIGYSLNDPDFRQIWQLIKDRLGKLRRHAYVISIGSSKQAVTKYERRLVKVINLPKPSGKDYGDILEEVFDEFRDFWAKELPNHSSITEEGTKIQLSLNEDLNSRLVYFAIARNDVSFYRKYIFPVIEGLNYVPVTIEEFAPSYGNRLATMVSLVEKSAYVIVDVSTSENSSEFSMVINSGKDRERIIALVNLKSPGGFKGSYDILPTEDRAGILFIVKPPNFLDDPDSFAENFEESFRQQTSNNIGSIKGEPQRLFNKNEYVAAVVSAITLLEDALRNQFKYEQSGRFIPLSELIKLAVNKNLIDKKEYLNLSDWIALRNRFVHTSERYITRQQAKKIIDQTSEIINFLNIL